MEVPSIYDLTQRSRYLKTRLRDIVDGDFLYLDVDTIICDSLDEIDNVEADLAAVADDNGTVKVKNKLAETNCVKAGFGKMRGAPFYNGGVFLVRDTDPAHRFFDSWHDRWRQSLKNGIALDQPALCQANLDVGLPIKELPGEWNCQVCSAVGPYYFKKAKVIHYYASYGSFKDAVLISRIKNSGGIDSVAAAIAKAPKSQGIGFYHHSYKGHLRYLSSWFLHSLMTMPLFYRIAKESLVFLSKPLSWILGLRQSAKKECSRPNPLSGNYKFEKLNRGLVAMKVDGGVFLSWRILAWEDPVFGTAQNPLRFTLFRDGNIIAELSGKTNFLDKDGTMDSEYIVKAGNDEESKVVRPFPSGENWFDIPLEKPADSPFGPYTINDVSVGDLDGDGSYELVVKWDSAGKDNSVPGMTGNVLLDAYKLDGRRLWARPIDLGVNIRAGAHYTQFLVYDFDGDGKSEVVLKTAPGSKDGKGGFVNLASESISIREADNLKDFRDSNGMVLDGDEFLTVFRGEDGQAQDTIYYPNQRVDSRLWGDDSGNRSERYTAAVAWLDGKRPYAFYMRGYYWGKNDCRRGRQCACAVSLEDGHLKCGNSFDTFDVKNLEGGYKGVDGYRRGNEKYIGEGNHNCAVADVDGDGREEVLTGALCYKLDRRDRLGVKWCTFRGHGDALHLGAYRPHRRGYDYFTVHECGERHPLRRFMQLDYGFSVLDAANGRLLFHHPSPGDMGRGMMADVGAGGWYQFWGVSEVNGSEERVKVGPFARTVKGFERIDIPGASTNFRIFWDGDLYDELLDGEAGGPLEVTSWNGNEMERIFRTEGCVSINGTKANPCLQADILGDWREEIIMAREDNSALRVFVSDIPSDYSFKTLMHDPVYREGVAAEQTAYNQPPHIGFCLRERA